MQIKEVAEISGVSVRTLQHYDRIGLLVAGRNSQNDYREYDDTALDRLQQVLLFRECGFSLMQIKSLLDDPRFDRVKALELQKKILQYEQERLEKMLHTLEQTISHTLKGEPMSAKDKFRGFDFSENKYTDEAKERWGDEAVDKSNAFVNAMSADEKASIEEKMNALFQSLATLREKDPASKEAQEGIARMYEFFNKSFGVTYTLEMFQGVGQMYVEDERFTENIDAFGDGLAPFLAEAMRIFAQNGGKQ